MKNNYFKKCDLYGNAIDDGFEVDINRDGIISTSLDLYADQGFQAFFPNVDAMIPGQQALNYWEKVMVSEKRTRYVPGTTPELNYFAVDGNGNGNDVFVDVPPVSIISDGYTFKSRRGYSLWGKKQEGEK
jgi:hypothetical protein